MVYAKKSWKQEMINLGLDQPEAQNGCPIANSYEKGEIEEIMKEAGFIVHEIAQDHIFQYVVDEYKKFKYIRQPYFEKMPSEMIRYLEKQIGWHLLITAKVL